MREVMCTKCKTKVPVPDVLREKALKSLTQESAAASPDPAAKKASITFSCDKCGKTMMVKLDLRGKKVRCKGCKEVIVVPDPNTEPAPAATPPPVPSAPPAADKGDAEKKPEGDKPETKKEQAGEKQKAETKPAEDKPVEKKEEKPADGEQDQTAPPPAAAEPSTPAPAPAAEPKPAVTPKPAAPPAPASVSEPTITPRPTPTPVAAPEPAAPEAAKMDETRLAALEEEIDALKTQLAALTRLFTRYADANCDAATILADALKEQTE